ncbi:polyprenyl diphosphate synthase [Spiroplasma endosymbiont of Aspidapion aeneum]|uniref:polyprenyl diphosphate synthase n=1 Tax=Spiroplasma endosymbiont of Aspidapion aeneum TaxID=3066276 RepID=UPI00313DB70C
MDHSLKHLAIILDGNGRWAERESKPRSYGHKVGFEKIEELCEWTIEQDIRYLSLFCFSTENWKRDINEVSYLFNLISTFYKRYKKFSTKHKIKVIWVGRRTKISADIKEKLELLENKTNIKDQILTLNLCIDYGSLEEIKYSIANILNDYKDKNTFLKNFQEIDLFKYMYTNQSPPVDFLVRPGGENRVSNFLLLQLYYAELYFCDKYWPEFNKNDFQEAIENYYSRKRRFGDVLKNE